MNGEPGGEDVNFHEVLEKLPDEHSIRAIRLAEQD
jgi:hypothetical protein